MQVFIVDGNVNQCIMSGFLDKEFNFYVEYGV